MTVSEPARTSGARLLIATSNPHKLQEIRSLLSSDETVDPAALDLVSLDAFASIPEPDETGTTFEENARLKARYYAAATHMITIAEDSGLEIDALGGEPGVRSARFLRSEATYPERFDEILRRLSETAESPRTARFVCAVCVVREGEIVFETRAAVEGTIAPTPRGDHGFGYDPIFYYPPYGGTLAEVSQADKLRVAHRGVTFRAVAAWLRSPSTTTSRRGQL